MYCSSCGVAVTKTLSYCNHCGAKLNRDDGPGDSSEVRPDFLAFLMVATFIFGLVAITILLGVMKNVVGLPVEQVLLFGLVPFILMLVLEGVFIRLLLRGRRDAEERRGSTLAEGQATNELDAAQAGVLPEARPLSVTEHTTRAFEPSYRDRK